MREFGSKMVRVTGDEASMLEPVEFDGRVSEADLERWLVRNPELSGEPLLVLDSQLAEFAEDKDRLDILALDQSGEIVLLELKVDGAFRVTDLQALAYAAGYSAVKPGHYAAILRNRWKKENRPESTLDDAKGAIVEFVDVLDEFDEWLPSKRVRIKLVAPSYPKRVLHTVRWLGDVYAMPIEAIQVQLFEDSAGCYHLTFERLLPLKSDDAFDLTVRDTEERIATTRQLRKPPILRSLLAAEVIQDGQELWLSPNVLPSDARELFDANNIAFRLLLDASAGQPKFRWRASPESEEKVLWPTEAWFYIFGAVLPDRDWTYSNSSVFNHYSLEPGGPTLEEVARDHGVW